MCANLMASGEDEVVPSPWQKDEGALKAHPSSDIGGALAKAKHWRALCRNQESPHVAKWKRLLRNLRVNLPSLEDNMAELRFRAEAIAYEL